MQPTAQTLIAAVLASGVTSAVFTWLFGEVSRTRERRQKRREILGSAVSDLLSTRRKLLLASAVADEMHTFFDTPREVIVPLLPNMLRTLFKIDDSVHQSYERAGELLAATNPVLAAELRGRTRLLGGISTLAEVLPDVPILERTDPTLLQLTLLKNTTLPMIDTAAIELAERQGWRIARSVRAHLEKPVGLTAADRRNLQSMVRLAMASGTESAEAAPKQSGDERH